MDYKNGSECAENSGGLINEPRGAVHTYCRAPHSLFALSLDGIKSVGQIRNAFDPIEGNSEKRVRVKTRARSEANEARSREVCVVQWTCGADTNKLKEQCT